MSTAREQLAARLERIVGFAQEIQRAVQAGDAMQCARHVEYEAKAALREGGVASLRAPHKGPDALIQAAEEAANVLASLATRVKWYKVGNVERSEVDHWRKLADDIRELVVGSGAETPPQPEIPK